MELIKDKWTKEDIEEFQKYLSTFKNDIHREWSENLLKTSLPVLCMKTKEINDIASKIYKGNYLSFLDLMIWEYYENTAINGCLINKLKDFDVIKKYLDIYSKRADN